MWPIRNNEDGLEKFYGAEFGIWQKIYFEDRDKECAGL